MQNFDMCKVLTEAAVPYYMPTVKMMNEETQLKVTDEVLTGMMRFITDKYNSLDFSEIEKSAGDYNRFKYRDLIDENCEILRSIYSSTTDQGAEKYLNVVSTINDITRMLSENSKMISELYRMGDGMTQLIYVSLVAACVYSIGALVCNTIRFVTTDQDADCEVLFDEIPDSIRNVHIKNVLYAQKSIPDIIKYFNTAYAAKSNGKSINESIAVGAVATAVVASAAVLMMIPKIIYLIREIIYSIYYSRIKKADMLEVQIQLIKTNIESLEAGRGNKKIIARQKKVVDKLEKLKNKLAVRLDTTNVAVEKQKSLENTRLRVEKDSPIVTGETDDSSILI